jgi:DNA-binding MarR family transcriptional regulator
VTRRWYEVTEVERHAFTRDGFRDGPHVLGAVTLLARLVQDAVGTRLAELGITFAQAIAMVRLWQTEDGHLSQSALIERLAVSRASGSLVLRELESAGLVSREIDPTDARRQIVRITDEGRRLERPVHEAFELAETRFFEPVGSKEWWTTYRSLRSAIDVLLSDREGSR